MAGKLAGTGPSEPGSPYYTEHDVQTLRGKLRALEGEVDILLTCEWPRSILQVCVLSKVIPVHRVANTRWGGGHVSMRACEYVYV